MASSRLATVITSSTGTKRNCASGSTNFLISHGQATLSTFTRSRVIHFMPTSFRNVLPHARSPGNAQKQPDRRVSRKEDDDRREQQETTTGCRLPAKRMVFYGCIQAAQAPHKPKLVVRSRAWTHVR